MQESPALRARTREDPLQRGIVVAILLLAGLFDGISGNPIHSILLFGAAGSLVWDAARHRSAVPVLEVPTAPPFRPTRGLATVVVLGVLVYAIVVGGFARYSWPMTVAVVVPAVLVLVLARPGSIRSGPEPEKIGPVGIVAWTSMFLALALWELTSLLLQPTLTTDSYAHPTISVMTDPILASHLGRSVALVAWGALGWFLVER
jgi:hypothetical protein